MQSYEHQSSPWPLIGATIGEIFDQTMKQQIYYLGFAVIAAGDTTNNFRYNFWSDLSDDVDKAAKSLIALGFNKGDRLAIWAHNHYNWIVLQIATAKIGVILVTINPAYKTNELRYALQQSGAKAIFLIDKYKTTDYLEMLMDVDEKGGYYDNGQFFFLNNIPEQYNQRANWDIFMRLGMHIPDDIYKHRQAELSFDDPINIQYTSGTTGAPKGVVLTHHNLVNNAFAVAEYMRLTEKDRLCIPVPFYHCFGMVLGTLACITHGSTIVLPGAGFNPIDTLRVVEEERCTALHGVPTMFIAELEHAKRFNLQSLRTGVMAGAPCPTEIMRRVNTEMHMTEIVIAYGQTETSPVITMTRTEDSLEHRVSTVGRPFPNIEIKIANPDTGEVLPRGEVGEICARGYAVMRGYWNNPEATGETIDDMKWLHTGDLGTMDNDGYVIITGRLKDMVIRGGENIYPREIEEFLYSHPAVADVQVVGIPDQKYGEELAACIKLKPDTSVTEEEIRNFFVGKLARFKIPKYVLFVTDYPMTITGKVQKYKLREEIVERLGLA